MDEIHQKNLYDYYKIKEPKQPGLPPKIWGIDSMSTALSMAIVRLYFNPEMVEDKNNRESEKKYTYY